MKFKIKGLIPDYIILAYKEKNEITVELAIETFKNGKIVFHVEGCYKDYKFDYITEAVECYNNWEN